MSQRGTTILASLALATVTAMALPTSYAVAAGDSDIVGKVQSAKTAADHEAIAKYYDGKAAEATKEAAEHRRMGESYKGLSGSVTGKGYAPSAMPQHCDAIAKSLDSEAENYKAMAQAHRDLAKTVK